MGSVAVERYRRALDGFDAVVRAVPADAWADPSPCSQWTARDVAGHVVTNQRWLASLGGHGPAPERPSPPGDALGADPVADWTSARAGADAVLADDAALDVAVATPFGEMPLRGFLEVFVTDVVTHTWDLARAAGRDVRLDPDVVGAAHARMAPLDEALRRPGLFAPAVELPDGDAQDRFLAYLGRDPR